MYAFDAIEPEVFSAEQDGRLSAGRAAIRGSRRGAGNSEVGMMRSWDASSGQGVSQVTLSCWCNA